MSKNNLSKKVKTFYGFIFYYLPTDIQFTEYLIGPMVETANEQVLGQIPGLGQECCWVFLTRNSHYEPEV